MCVLVIVTTKYLTNNQDQILGDNCPAWPQGEDNAYDTKKESTKGTHLQEQNWFFDYKLQIIVFSAF